MKSNLNMDFNISLSINTNLEEWLPSPNAKVLRIPLERKDIESGHATSVVKYVKGAKFNEHQHPKGEEIFVLEGIFSDETGDYPAGTYLRNPPGTKHTPFSKEGCILFVKLHQFDSDDREIVRINMHESTWLQGQGNLEVMPLHEFDGKSTALVKWPKGEKFLPHRHFGGEEVFVLSGVFKDEHGSYPAGTWIRNKHLSSHHPFVEEETIILVKVGHLML